MASFGPVAPYYDLLMRTVPYRMWASYYELLLARLGVSPHRLLDVCCGTGAIAEILTKDGYDVYGFDLSAAMIEEAKRKAKRKRQKIRYAVADAAELDLGETFDSAYSFFDSLNYITDPSDLHRAILRVGAHIEPGGSFVFDLNTAYAFEAKMFDQTDMRKDAPIRYRWKGEYDSETLVISVNMNFFAADGDFTETHIQRAHPEEEVRTYLEEAGFDSIYVYNSYTLDPPRKKSDRVHYACLKSD